jgi:hypothetical protein
MRVLKVESSLLFSFRNEDLAFLASDDFLPPLQFMVATPLRLIQPGITAARRGFSGACDVASVSAYDAGTVEEERRSFLKKNQKRVPVGVGVTQCRKGCGAAKICCP